jgi:hypothetical protein
MKTVLLLSILIFSASAFARAGFPKEIRCSLSSIEYKEDIKDLMDINTLLNESTYHKMSTVDFQCQAHGCVAEIEMQGIYMRYHYNTQNGGLELEDKSLGQSVYNSWLNQHDVTQSGYLLGSVWLTNRRGGLLGSPRVFQVEAGCWALSWY